MENFDRIIDKLNANIIEEVLRQLHASRLTQKELANLTGINASTLSKLLLGKTRFSIEQLTKIALVLGKDISEFLSFRNIGIENASNIYSTTNIQESDNFVFDTNRPAFNGYLGNTYYVYFHSTMSSESKLIYGELTFNSTGKDRCRVDLVLYTGKTDVSGKKITKNYIGDMIISIPQSSCYCILTNQRIGEMCFFIFHHMFLFNQEMICRMAVALTTSSGENKRPTIHRLVITKQKFDLDANPHDLSFLQGQLKLNSQKIIISKKTFETIKSQLSPDSDADLIFYLTEIEKLFLHEEFYIIDENKILLSDIDVITKVRGISLLREKSIAENFNKISTTTDEFLFEYIQHSKNN